MKRKILFRCLSLLYLVWIPLQVRAQVFRVDTLQYAGDINKHINVVILGDGYLESDLSQFRKDAKNFKNYFLYTQPYSNYRSFFNVFSINVPSNERGAAMHPDSLIDNYFGSTFWYADIERLLFPTNTVNIISVLAANFPAYDQVVMLVNSTKYGGSGGWLATASLNNESKEIAMHELGHSFADLADEYWAGDQYAGESINMTQETSLNNLRWRNWHGDQDIGLYPHEESIKWHRPHQNCKMRYLNRRFCSVCTEGTIERIYALVSPLRSFYPDSLIIPEPGEFQEFSLDLIKPFPNTLKTTWKLNGEVVQTNTDTIQIERSEYLEGDNSVVAIIEDTSLLIRPYEDESYHFISVRWKPGSTSTGKHNIMIPPGVHSISLYPNPFENYFHVKILGETNDHFTLELYDAQGKYIRVVSPEYNGITTIDLSDLNDGVYFVHIILNHDRIAVRKIVKL